MDTEYVDRFTQTISRNIRAARKKRGMKQYELAEAINSNQSSISQWENAHSAPTVANIAQIASALDVSPEFLMSPEYGAGSFGDAAPLPGFPHALPICVGYEPQPDGTSRLIFSSEPPIAPPEPVLRKHPKGFFVAVSDTSCNAWFHPGTYVLVCPEGHLVADSEKIGWVSQNRTAPVFRRILLHGGHVTLTSLSRETPVAEDWDVGSFGKSCEIVGYAVWDTYLMDKPYA